jgi:hypothetical protein
MIGLSIYAVAGGPATVVMSRKSLQIASAAYVSVHSLVGTWAGEIHELMAALVHDESANCALKALLIQPPEEVLAMGAESGLLEETGDELVRSRLGSLVCVGVHGWGPVGALT